MGVTVNNKSTTEPPPYTDSSLSHRGGLNALYWYQIFALASAVVKVQEMFSLHGTIAMYHHGETLLSN